MTPLQAVRDPAQLWSKLLYRAGAPFRRLQGAWLSARFRRRWDKLAGERKIVYALTPPPNLKNIGDQAQAVAIHAWLAKHFPGIPVVEVDKLEVFYCRDHLGRIVRPDDLIFLHSGGNLGDRGLWSERARRLVIASFPRNRIVSLPQTIHFSDTPAGREQREASRRIYAAHPHLTVIGRDHVSGAFAAQLFPRAQTFCAPDFVLSLQPPTPAPPSALRRVLLCLRQDDESVLSRESRAALARSLPYETTVFDTTLRQRIPASRREAILARTLALFASHDAVVTDRYHGLIFALLCRRPTVVLRTQDHKLTAAIDWFREVAFVRLATRLESVPEELEASFAGRSGGVPDWNALHFDRLPELLGLARQADAA